MPDARPNILFIMSDEQRYDCVGANGNPLIRTPNLDALARQSANLSNCFVQAPVCTPSRQTLFTGRYPHCHRNRVNYTAMHSNDKLMQADLRDVGYATGCVGKLHYYPPTRDFALSTGFDRVLLHDGAHTDHHSDYVSWLRTVSPEEADNYRYRQTSPAQGGNPYRARIPDELHETTWCGRQTREMITEFASADKPFFLFSSYWKPHPPFEVPDPWASMYDDVEIPLPDQITLDEIQRYPLPVQKIILRVQPPEYQIHAETRQWMYRSYYGAISQIDREVGLTLQTLAKLGLEDNTIVIFCSDHGDDMLEHGFRGKNLFFESSIRVPMMIRLPNVVRPGVFDDLIETTDLLPTVFDLAGIETPTTSQGRSFASPVTSGSTGGAYSRRKYVFGENIIPEVITCDPLDYPYVRGEGISGIRHPDAKMVRSTKWKYNYYVGQGHELYDLEADVLEKHNLADEPRHAHVVARMRQALLDWLITADEPDQIAPRWSDV